MYAATPPFQQPPKLQSTRLNLLWGVKARRETTVSRGASLRLGMPSGFSFWVKMQESESEFSLHPADTTQVDCYKEWVQERRGNEWDPSLLGWHQERERVWHCTQGSTMSGLGAHCVCVLVWVFCLLNWSLLRHHNCKIKAKQTSN